MTQPKKVLHNARLDTVMYKYHLKNSHNWCSSAQKEFEKRQKIQFEKCRSWSLDYMMQLLAQTQIYNWRACVSVSNVRLR